MPSGPASARPALALSQKPASFWFHPSSSGWIWAHASLRVPLSWPGRRLRIEQARTGKHQDASSKPRRARTRDAQHRLETKSEAGAHAAAGRVAVTAPETAGRALPRGERVAARLTYSGRLERAPHAVAATSTTNYS